MFFVAGLALGIALSAAPTPVVPISAGNAMTLPAQRHVVRMTPDTGPAIGLLAVQQGPSGGLRLFRSDDEAQTWTNLAALQPDGTHRDRAELIAVGPDVAVVYSWEDSALSGSDRHDVFFQWWRFQSEGRTYVPEPAVRVFDSTSSSTAYSRALLARDSLGRLWVQAFRFENGGASRAVITVSTDEGRTFHEQPSLDLLPKRGGGRLLHLGTKLLFVYAMHQGLEPTRMRLRDDSAPLSDWTPVSSAFSDGIYHGAALSAVASGDGGMHLVYKDESDQLCYRRFDGTRFGPRTVLETSGNWALQSAVTLRNNTLHIFYNLPLASGHYRLQTRTLNSDGVLSPATVLDDSATFKGYLAAPATLPASVTSLPCFYGRTPDASSSGQLMLVHSSTDDEPEPPPPNPGTQLFADDFERATGLGGQWREALGKWRTNGTAISDRDSGNLAIALTEACADCRVETVLAGFGVRESGVFVRGQGAVATDRYDAVILANGQVSIRKIRGTSVQVLGTAASGIPKLSRGAVLSLEASGAQPVLLVVKVNGAPRLSVEDDLDVISAPGLAGLWTTHAGVWFDNFKVTTLGERPDAGAPSDAGVVPDA
jgi:hypothetical protein